jgi:DNA topoisomerase III
LYERHKALTYPRTDSKHLPQEMRRELPAAFEALLKAGFSPQFVQTAQHRLAEKRDRVFDDSKVGDHHALLPTAQPPKSPTMDESRIYGLIANRLLAAFQDDLVTAITDVTVLLETTPHLFYARGKVVLNAGWTNILTPFEADKDETLPVLARGETLKLKSSDLKNETTKPPKRFTESDLLGLMENAGNKLSAEGKEILKGRGIGTPATRASILLTLQKREYVQIMGRTLAPTEKGITLIDLLPSQALKSPEMTAQWELQLAEIEADKSKAGAFSRDLNTFIIELVRLLGVSPPHASRTYAKAISPQE